MMQCLIEGCIKTEAEKEFNKLKKDKFEYQYQFMKRIHEIQNLQKKQWMQFKKTDDFIEQQNCLKELHLLTVTLADHFLFLLLLSCSKIA